MGIYLGDPAGIVKPIALTDGGSGSKTDHAGCHSERARHGLRTDLEFTGRFRPPGELETKNLPTSPSKNG
jgi:hypothetical protein